VGFITAKIRLFSESASKISKILIENRAFCEIRAEIARNNTERGCDGGDFGNE
jgi:hypothetical protein